jgi:hypothetical protein
MEPMSSDQDENATTEAAAQDDPEQSEGCWAKFEDWLAGDSSDDEGVIGAQGKETLSEADIENRLEKALSETNINSRGQNFLVLNALIFIIFCIMSNPVERIATVNSFVKQRLESTYFQSNPDKEFKDILGRHDLQKYIEYVLLPVCFGDESITTHNYLIALRFSLKRVKFQDNKYDDYNDVVTEVKEYHGLSYESFSEGEDTDGFNGHKYDEDCGYNRAGAFVYLMQNMTLEEARNDWKTNAGTDYIDTKTSSLVVEVIVQNSNLGVTLDYIQVFEFQDSGYIKKAAKSVGAFPERYAQWTNFFAVLTGLYVLYILGLCFHSYLTLSKISRILTVLWTQFKLEIPWTEYVGTASVVTAIVAMSLYSSSALAYSGKFELPMTSNDDIDELTDHLWQFRAFIRASAIAALLITLEAIAILKDKFPSFGLLFDTVRRANVDISNFGIILTALLIAFGLMGTVCFGAQSEEFSSVEESMLTLFAAVLNQSFYAAITKTNSELATLFFVSFVVLFNFVLLNMFLAIVMSTFKELSDENSQLLKARASLTADQVKKVRNNWINLLCCRIPIRTQTEDAYAYYELRQKILSTKEEDHADNDMDKDKLEFLRQAIIKSRVPSLWDIVSYNLGVISNDLYSHKVMRKEIIRELTERIKEIEKMHRDKTREEQKLTKNMDYRYLQVREMLIFLLYVSVFTIFIALRMRVPETYDVYNALSSAITAPEYEENDVKYDFYDNDRLSRIRSWTSRILAPVLTEDYIGNQNLLVKENLVRFTLQLKDTEENDNDSTKMVERLVVVDDSWSNRDFLTKSGSTFMYVDAGEDKSYKDEGGFVLTLIPSSPEFLGAAETWLNLSNLGETCILIAVEYVTYNSNYDLYCYNTITFTQDLAGKITPDFTITSVQLDLYTVGAWLGIFETMFVLFTLYYTVIEVRAWLVLWREADSIRKENWRKQGIVESILFSLGVYTQPQGGVEAIVLTVGRFIKNTAIVVYTFFTQFIEVTYRHTSSSFFRLANVVCILLSFAALYYELLIISSSFIRDFEQPSDYDYINDFAIIVSHQYLMQGLLAYTLLFSYLRLLQFFNFSKKLSMLTDSLRSAALDIAFFMSMFVSILFSYALMGYLLLGHYHSDFGSLSTSFVTCYTFLLGQFDLDMIQNVDERLGLVFFITFSIVFNFLLINMFIAIIVGHYRLTQSEYTRQKRGFFAEVLLILRSRCRERKKLRRNMTVKQEVEEQEDNRPMIDEESFELLEVMDVDRLTPNYYLMEMEKVLKLQSKNTVLFSSFKPEFMNFYELASVVLPADKQDLAIINEVIWSRCRVSEKLRLWRRMGLNWEERQAKKAFSDEVLLKEKEKSRPLSPLQVSLWEATSEEEQLELWAGEHCFDNRERINVWNTLKFSEEILPEATKELLLDERLPSSEKEQTLHKWANDLISPLRSTSIKVKKQPRERRIELVKNWREVQKDTRLMLWMSLDVNEQIALYLNQFDADEANLMEHMIISETGGNLILLGETDNTLGQILDSQICSKYTELASFQAEACIAAKNKQRLEDAETELMQTKNYFNFLTNSIRENELSAKRLRETYNIA